MTTTTTHDHRINGRQSREAAEPGAVATRIVEGGVGLEAAAGAGAVALAILGLVGVLPADMVAIAVIAAGAGFLIRGASVATRARRLMARTEGQVQEAEMVGGIGTEIVAGIGGVVLGILALIGIDAGVLLAAAVVAFGAALFLGAGSKRAMDAAARGYDSGTARLVAEGDAAAEIFIGLGVATLGVLALVSVAPATLTLVGVLAVGGGMLLEGVPVLARPLGII